MTGTGHSYTAANAAKHPFGAQDDHAHVLVATECSDRVGDLEPLGNGERIDRWAVHHHFGDAVGTY
jgi:hypothetical protein